ncbi:hypothetical protein [Photorhabdus hindustanensis]|uniref:Uncharacterized protein n=1 Tax=Photorhabdus hindustanensis TaxID=2918802 RepID=A0A2S8Q1W8_9GAMM|nr:hypothetical protein [Photorhabdus hindustanensis]PQQ25860.1 hypothetical protein C6H66_11195 [Photorhabdus hindustanensis]
MGKQAVFTMKLESDLREYKYRTFLQEKVDIARQSVKEGNGVEHSDVQAIFAARREQVKSRK